MTKDRAKWIRKTLGSNQTEFAVQLGLRPLASQVSRFENGAPIVGSTLAMYREMEKKAERRQRRMN